MTKNSMQTIAITGASNFKFSAVRPDDLGASEYTLVTIAIDISTSVGGFEKELEACVKAILGAVKKSPRVDNLLVRIISFNSDLKEIFGFKSLQNIDSNDIVPLRPSGYTVLYDASYETLTATEQYAQILYDQEFDVNAAVYIITDGWDTASTTANPKMIADRLSSIRKNEKLESIVTMLIGVNTADSDMRTLLESYSTEAKFDQFIDAGDANASNLAKLAGFVSRSISTQSQALASGNSLQNLKF